MENTWLCSVNAILLNQILISVIRSWMRNYSHSVFCLAGYKQLFIWNLQMKDNSSRDILQMVPARCLFSALVISSCLLSQDGLGPTMDKGLRERCLHVCMGTDCTGSTHTAHSSVWLLTRLFLYIRNRGWEGDSVVKVTGCSCRGQCLVSRMYMVAHNYMSLQFHETWCLLLTSKTHRELEYK